MKHRLSICLTLLLSFYSSSQWKTLFEAGMGTPLSLRYDCSPTFIFSADPSSNENIINFNIVDNQNTATMYAYLSPFNSQCELKAGIYKYIPEMGQYTSLRVFLDFQLEDTVGTIFFATSPDTVLINPNNGSNNWNVFASDVASMPIYFNNWNEDKNLFFYSEFDVSPGNVKFNYLRVEADTTHLLNVVSINEPDFKVFSSEKQVYIQTSANEVPFEVQLFDFAGKCVFQEQLTGEQSIPFNYSTGFYQVMILQNGSYYRTKIYLE